MARSRRFFLVVATLWSCTGCASDKPGAGTNNGLSPVSGTAGTSTLGAAGSQPQLGTSGASGSKPVVAGTAGGLQAQAGRSGSAAAGQSGSSVVTASAGTSASADGGAGGSTSTPVAPVCMSKAPAEFELNTSIGSGGSNHEDSAHFALYGVSNPDAILNFMEAAHKCFIEDWCFRTPGLSSKSDDSGPYSKTNIYSDGAMAAGGLTYWDARAELAYIHVLPSQIGDPKSTVHEYGHAITMSEHNWIEQKRTGYWWETVANWVSYSFLTSPYCEAARTEYDIKQPTTIIDQMHTLQTVYGQSYSVICNDQNYYQAWPFLTYLTNNPDQYPGLGKFAVQDLMRKYDLGSNETPLHTLERIAAPTKTQTILGRYWARMAYMDIGLPVGHKDFLSSRGTLNFANNLDAAGDQTYKVKASRKPQYGGANINPLEVSGTGDVSIAVTNLGNGLTESNFTATLAIRAKDDSVPVRYVDLPHGMGQATIASQEEASLVVVNTPDELYLFDPQSVGSPENVGLNYQVKITGATPSN